jgi:hypothetical protein
MKLAWLVLPLAACALDDPGDDDAIASLDQDSLREAVQRVATISYAPNSFVIGNAYPGWTDVVQGPAQFSSGPGNPSGASYRWGYLYGENFDRCAWIDDSAASPITSVHGTNRCGTPQQIDTPYFLATFTNHMHNLLPGDGSITHMHYAGSGCTDRHGYGNVAPWRVPATPANSRGIVPDGHELHWRYVSRDGHWVLVRDPTAAAGTPNWYFVHRGCVSIANLY